MHRRAGERVVTAMKHIVNFILNTSAYDWHLAVLSSDTDSMAPGSYGENFMKNLDDIGPDGMKFSKRDKVNFKTRYTAHFDYIVLGNMF